ncbi:TIGR03009 domain-containing protein [Tuwongella immobilis]|uniref:Hypothetical conserved protein n=1 Tax=Tuwongella immobilis TaxID=692036 RepID=A0A6C2YPL1_9BACT|nr:TIGR03009 domain-containing protein [Tuwongella immobilis]VIP02965.1 Hypothetical conserved protein OS=uncultured planctomycete GN=HGMM_F37F03C09 PE=4 SV=1 [Tuwongella immobilis]VTS02983.1 Hypothetical conserved protein OS=uncultured planctomycete GN=HGMM_F37F03C09 PE=4 SV=1 [Tuwongella immobilis]
MRCAVWCVTGMLILTGSVFAQNPVAPPADPMASRLDVLLKAWEDRMKNTSTLYTECTRTEINKTFNTTEVFTGQARYMKPNLARLDLLKKDDPNNYEKYVCTGTYLYEYRPKNKLVRIHDMPKGNGNAVADNASMSFIFGMKADEAKQRFQLTLRKEDNFWIYVDILPKYPADKQEFTKAQMVFYASPASNAMLPRRLWFEHPNGDEIMWEFNTIQTNVQLERNDFVAPSAPKDWQVVRANAQAPQAQPNPGPGRSVMPMGDARPENGIPNRPLGPKP